LAEAGKMVLGFSAPNLWAPQCPRGLVIPLPPPPPPPPPPLPTSPLPWAFPFFLKNKSKTKNVANTPR